MNNWEIDYYPQILNFVFVDYYQQNNPSIRRTISKVARNRWLLAVTLLNNQTLIAHRRTKFVDSFTISKRVDECNSDDELLLFQD